MVRAKKGKALLSKIKNSVAKEKGNSKQSIEFLGPHVQLKLDKDLSSMSEQEMKEMLMLTLYKMALLRSQVEALNNILIKNKLASYEEIWKETNNNMKNAV